MATPTRACRQAIYVSDCAWLVTPAALVDIGLFSRRNNAALGVTGLLLHIDGAFLRVVEGAPEKIDGLPARIANDPRHRNLTILGDLAVERSEFQGWGVATFDVTRESIPGAFLFEPTPRSLAAHIAGVGSRRVRIFLETFYQVHAGAGARDLSFA